MQVRASVGVAASSRTAASPSSASIARISRMRSESDACAAILGSIDRD
jgi:hypothetical protein